MPNNNQEIERRLWEMADELRANSSLTAQEYSTPVLGLIFLRYASVRFQAAQAEVETAAGSSRRRQIGPDDYKARGVLYVPEEAHFDRLRNLPEGADLATAISDAMKAIEETNPELRDVLPKEYRRMAPATLQELVRVMASIPADLEGDAFGRIYEYFLGHFAMSEGHKGGEFFTPTAIVRLIVEVLEPFQGRVLDPACGSGGMFVQSARFVDEHRRNGNGPQPIALYGQESKTSTVRLCRMNLAVHGLDATIRQGNSYYEPLYDSYGPYDFCMANPPFNVNKVDKERLADDPRFPYGLPKPDNANYLWIQLFYSALNQTGRAGFVMANSAADARHSEQEIRRGLLEDNAVDVMVAVGPNFFYTVPLSCTLWFLDRGKRGTPREDTVLFIDARDIYTDVDRAHREWSDAQIEFLANIVRLYRGEAPERRHESQALMEEQFPEGTYRDVPGLCKVAALEEIAEQDWSLNPGRYVGISRGDSIKGVELRRRLEALAGELKHLARGANSLQISIDTALRDIVEALDD